MRGLNAVPALPKKSSAYLLGKLPPQPVTFQSVSLNFSSFTPSFSRASSIRAVSSETNKSRISVTPFASAANNSVRFEILFEPGSFTVPSAWLAADRCSCSIFTIFLLFIVCSVPNYYAQYWRAQKVLVSHWRHRF